MPFSSSSRRRRSIRPKVPPASEHQSPGRRFRCGGDGRRRGVRQNQGVSIGGTISTKFKSKATPGVELSEIIIKTTRVSNRVG